MPNELHIANAAALTRLQLFDAIGKALKGRGVEFGAGANPFPVGAQCEVLYADRNTNENLRERRYFGDHELISTHLYSDLESMEGIADDSVDFVIASHVIEHTSNPLKAFDSAFKRLRPGGRMVLVIPDKHVTFDRDRPVTTMEHLLADYTRPSRERDWEHYIEFFSKCFPQPDPLQSARGVFERGDDIHFHVWTYESFQEMVEYVRKKLQPWSSVWSQRRLSDQDIEFYFVLTK